MDYKAEVHKAGRITIPIDDFIQWRREEGKQEERDLASISLYYL